MTPDRTNTVNIEFKASSVELKFTYLELTKAQRLNCKYPSRQNLIIALKCK